MIDNVLITLVCRDQEFDMELPAAVKAAQLKPVLLEALDKRGIRLGSDAALICNGTMLTDTDTLYSAGVWDGSRLTVA